MPLFGFLEFTFGILFGAEARGRLSFYNKREGDYNENLK